MIPVNVIGHVQKFPLSHGVPPFTGGRGFYGALLQTIMGHHLAQITPCWVTVEALIIKSMSGYYCSDSF